MTPVIEMGPDPAPAEITVGREAFVQANAQRHEALRLTGDPVSSAATRVHNMVGRFAVNQLDANVKQGGEVALKHIVCALRAEEHKSRDCGPVSRDILYRVIHNALAAYGIKPREAFPELYR